MKTPVVVAALGAMVALGGCQPDDALSSIPPTPSTSRTAATPVTTPSASASVSMGGSSVSPSPSTSKLVMAHAEIYSGVPRYVPGEAVPGNYAIAGQCWGGQELNWQVKLDGVEVASGFLSCDPQGILMQHAFEAKTAGDVEIVFLGQLPSGLGGVFDIVAEDAKEG